jgi:hypothetical protein
MPIYTFYRLAEGDETHPAWRGRDSGSEQWRLCFKKKLDEQSEDDLKEIIRDRINKDTTGKIKEGQWKVEVFMPGSGKVDEFTFEIDGGGLWLMS